MQHHDTWGHTDVDAEDESQMHDASPPTDNGQGIRVNLLMSLTRALDNRVAVDVGAERGGFASVLLDAGVDVVFPFETHPVSVAALRTTFNDVPSVHIFDSGVDPRGETVKPISVDASTGHPPDFSSAKIGFEEAAPRMRCEVEAQRQTLESLIVDGALPPRVGMLKMNVEQSDLLVVLGMEALSSDVVIVECRDDAHEVVDSGLNRAAQLVKLMTARGYSNFVMVRRQGELETLQLNSDRTQAGDWQSLIFVHDVVYPRLSAIIFDSVARSQQQLVDKLQAFGSGVQSRLTDAQDDLAPQIRYGDAAAAARLEILAEQELALDTYLDLSSHDGLWKWVAPQLGVLYQYDPVPFYVPEHYLESKPLPSPPTISIVTPTMNSEQFLKHTIRSVLDQDYKNLEYIIQDGGSSDKTLDLLEQNKSWMWRIHSERDNGMAQAINRGFTHATGEILAYLNSDDMLLPGTLNFIACYFATHPEVDVVYGHRVIVNENNAEIGRWVLPSHDPAVLSWADYVPQETLFWRRRIWDAVGAAMDESFRFALDWDLLLRFREAGATFARLPRFLGAFRVHQEQKTSRELADVGSSEMTRLREHYAGRPVSGEEIWQHLQPYLHRHKVYHKLYRLGVLRY